jgi:hypothetical protein
VYLAVLAMFEDRKFVLVRNMPESGDLEKYDDDEPWARPA